MTKSDDAQVVSQLDTEYQAAVERNDAADDGPDPRR